MTLSTRVGHVIPPMQLIWHTTDIPLYITRNLDWTPQCGARFSRPIIYPRFSIEQTWECLGRFARSPIMDTAVDIFTPLAVLVRGNNIRTDPITLPCLLARAGNKYKAYKIRSTELVYVENVQKADLVSLRSFNNESKLQQTEWKKFTVDSKFVIKGGLQTARYKMPQIS